MKKSLWNRKDSEIQQILEEYGIEMKEGYDRKKAIPLIQDFEKKLETGESVLAGEKDKNYIEELKKTQPKLRLTRCIFHNTQENAMPYIFVGHNGKGYYIPKETEVDVPDYILDSCIKDAIEERLFPEQQMNGDIQWKKRKLQRFPYTIVKHSFEVE